MSSTTPPLPREIQIEVTAACNLRCHMCLVRYRPPLNKIEGSMSFETFKAIVDELPDLEVVTLQGLGEPLLAPHLFEMIEYASNRGVRMGFNTNGTLLTAERAERLIDAGLDWLHVSLDGSSAQTYESIRDGSSFSKVADNVRRLVAAMRRRGVDRPRLSLVFVAMRRNVAELSGLVELAHEWGIDRLWVQNLSHSFSDTDPAGAYREIREFAAAEALWNNPTAGGSDDFDDARTRADELGVELRLPEVDERVARAAGTPGCDWPWRSAYVSHAGEVQPCCMVMGADRAVLGDVTSTPFSEVWTNEAYGDFRAALLTDDPPEVCRGCSMYRGVF